MIADISNRTISRLRPGPKVYEVRDKRLKGFLLRVLPSGKMSFICQYTRGGRITIGHVGIVTAVQARDEAREILARYELNGSPEGDRQNIDYTLKCFIDDEYAPWVLLHRKTGKQSVDRIRLHFFKDLADKKLHEITPHIIEKWQIQRLKSGTKANTINRDIATLKAALSKAVEWGFIHDHPLSKLRLLKVDNSSITRYLTESEETTLRQALDGREEEYRSKRESWNEWRRIRGLQEMAAYSAGDYTDHLKPMVLLTMNTGLRRGELFSLRWCDVDFDHRNLTVAGSYSKTGKTRHIPLNDEAFEVLQQWGAQTGQKSGLVFAGKSGGRFTDIKKSWSKLLQDAGIENFRWHDLRHHFASKLVMASVDLNTVRELLGHSTIATTLRYAHLAPEHKANAVAKIAYGTSTKSKIIPFKKLG